MRATAEQRERIVVNEALPEMHAIEGHLLTMRLITPDDAAYVHALRTDPRYNEHLSATTGAVQQQRDWIDSYKAREAAGTEYYYIIERKSDGLRCGVVRLYEIEDGRFTWGSWILDENKPFKAALESALLVYEVAFGRLNLQNAVFDVRKDNVRVISFHKRFGARETHSDEQDVFFDYSRSAFEDNRAKLYRLLGIDGGFSS